jgi:hypothetical protein
MRNSNNSKETTIAPKILMQSAHAAPIIGITVHLHLGLGLHININVNVRFSVRVYVILALHLSIPGADMDLNLDIPAFQHPLLSILAPPVLPLWFRVVEPEAGVRSVRQVLLHYGLTS